MIIRYPRAVGEPHNIAAMKRCALTHAVSHRRTQRDRIHQGIGRGLPASSFICEVIMKLRKYKEGDLALVRDAIVKLRQARDRLKSWPKQEASHG